MEAAYRLADEGFYSSDQFNRYQSLYSELSSEIVDSGNADVFLDLVPLLERWEFDEARELLNDELDHDRSPELEDDFDVFYVDSDSEDW